MLATSKHFAPTVASAVWGPRGRRLRSGWRARRAGGRATSRQRAWGGAGGGCAAAQPPWGPRLGPLGPSGILGQEGDTLDSPNHLFSAGGVGRAGTPPGQEVGLLGSGTQLFSPQTPAGLPLAGGMEEGMAAAGTWAFTARLHRCPAPPPCLIVAAAAAVCRGRGRRQGPCPFRPLLPLGPHAAAAGWGGP